MRAVWYERNGAAAEVLTLGEMATPAPGPREVLVRVHASGVNPADTYWRAGINGPMAGPRVIPNSDGAGLVEAVGPGVPETWIGQRVWLYNGQRGGRASGTAAEYIALDADLVTLLPAGISFTEGATLGIPCMTAHRSLFVAGPLQGRCVLVTGGAGAVGHYAVQLAHWAGATVIATVSSEDKAAHAKAGGADHVIDYKREDVAARVMDLTGGMGVDHVVDVDLGGDMWRRWRRCATAARSRPMPRSRSANRRCRSTSSSAGTCRCTRSISQRCRMLRASGRSPTSRHGSARGGGC